MRLRAAIFALLLPAFACDFLAGEVVAGEAEWKRFVSQGDHRARYIELRNYLDSRGVGDVVPPWHLLRQGTSWRRLKLPAFAVPPRRLWPRMVPLLLLLKQEVVPRVGKLEVVSGFRTRTYNRLAGGSRGSRHQYFEAVDLVPRTGISRSNLHEKLRALHRRYGPRKRMGLGLYSRRRFHIDVYRYRSW